LAGEQAAVQAGANQLRVPKPHRDAQQQSLDRAAEAVENLAKQAAKLAAEAAAKAADALDNRHDDSPHSSRFRLYGKWLK
jgi:hypothetical protein